MQASSLEIVTHHLSVWLIVVFRDKDFEYDPYFSRKSKLSFSNTFTEWDISCLLSCDLAGNKQLTSLVCQPSVWSREHFLEKNIHQVINKTVLTVSWDAKSLWNSSKYEKVTYIAEWVTTFIDSQSSQNLCITLSMSMIAFFFCDRNTQLQKEVSSLKAYLKVAKKRLKVSLKICVRDSASVSPSPTLM
jgi:hypothetical protein